MKAFLVPGTMLSTSEAHGHGLTLPLPLAMCPLIEHGVSQPPIPLEQTQAIHLGASGLSFHGI